MFSKDPTYLGYPEDGYLLQGVMQFLERGLISVAQDAYLLFEVSSILLINQNKVEIISCAELLIDVAESRCQVKAPKE